jgi:hypothetical protein
MNEMKTDREISERMKQIKAQLQALQMEYKELSCEQMRRVSPFAIGDIIEWKGKRGRIIKIRNWFADQPLWEVVNIRKDGTDGAISEVRPYQNPTLIGRAGGAS